MCINLNIRSFPGILNKWRIGADEAEGVSKASEFSNIFSVSSNPFIATISTGTRSLKIVYWNRINDPLWFVFSFATFTVLIKNFSAICCFWIFSVPTQHTLRLSALSAEILIGFITWLIVVFTTSFRTCTIWLKIAFAAMKALSTPTRRRCASDHKLYDPIN